MTDFTRARERVVYEKRGRVAYVTLNRPSVLNALDLKTHEELAEVWDEFERDGDIRVGVLTGAGDRAFSAGQDLKELAARIAGGVGPSTFGSRGAPGWPRLTERFSSITKPLIARVNGLAIGGGMELVLACDIVVAAEHATFALPEARLGLVAGAGGVFRLPRQIPTKIAMGYLLTGRSMTAQRAYELGLVNEVVPLDGLDACIDGWLADVLRCSPLSLKSIKEAVGRSSDLSLPDAFQATYEWENARLLGDEWREGTHAFLEKRPPRWSDG